MVSGKHYSEDQTVDRINDKIEKNEKTGCWEWQGALAGNGYAQISVNGETKNVHRIMQQKFNGGYTEEKPFTLHSCDNRKCVNPEHLSRGSHQDNMDDAVDKGRMRGPSFQGDDHPASKVNSEQVKEIRELYAEAKYTQSELADIYNIARTQVGHIVRGEQWQSAEGPVLSEKQRKQIESNHRSKERPYKQGSNHHSTNLTEEDVIEIRKKYHNKSIYQKDLADEYGVARSNIGQIVRGDSWKSAGGPTG